MFGATISSHAGGSPWVALNRCSGDVLPALASEGEWVRAVEPAHHVGNHTKAGRGRRLNRFHNQEDLA
jgi:hypothetical protein